MFPKRSMFDLTHERKYTCDMGALVPSFVQEVLPGDTFKCLTNAVVRLSPLLAPMMHRVDIFTHYYFVPYRLLWNNWQSFITGGEDGTDASVFPTVSSGASGKAAGTLWDYMGCPTNWAKDDGTSIPVANFSVSALPFRAYNMIYNEWYRDQNLIDPVAISLADGVDSTTNLNLLYRAWEKDYFTSALPWPQKGPDVLLPIGTAAPVSTMSVDVLSGVQDALHFKRASGSAMPVIGNLYTDSNLVSVSANPSPDNGIGSVYPSNLAADLSSATAVSVNDLRLANRVQQWQERNARGGSRYIESILAHFGIRSSDARLQRPEYLGGGRSPIVVSEVLQTSSTDSVSPQANMAGHGFAAGGMVPFKKSFEEHGIILGITSVLPRTAYMQGSPRMFNRRTRYDFFWPLFANLGEQSILKKEIFASAGEPDSVFGYAPRYDEYRHAESSVHGDFKGNLDFWHMARKFDSTPSLTSSFVTANPTKRVFATTETNSVYVQLLNQCTAFRPLPKRAVPQL